MKSLITIFVLYSFLLFAQSDTTIPSFPDVIRTTKTKNHKRISSTRLFAEIPEHFSSNESYLHPGYTAHTTSKHYIGFLVTYCSDEVRGLRGKSWSEVLEYFGEVRPRELRSELFIEQKVVTVNGYEGRYREYYQRGKHHLHLYFGNDDFAVQIEASTHLDSIAAIKEFRKIMQSVYYDEDDTLGLSEFPDTLVTEKTENHQRIKGTKLFAIIPEYFTKCENINQCFVENKKGCDCSIEFDENSFSRSIAKFADSKVEWDKSLESKYKSPVNFHSAPFHKKRIVINGFRGLYIESFTVNSSGNDYYSIRLIFGNDDFSAKIRANTPLDSEEAKNKILEIMKTVYFDKDFYMDELTDENFDFDKTITGLRHKGWPNQYRYSNYQKSNPESNGSFMVFKPIELEDYTREQIQDVFYQNVKIYEHETYKRENLELIETKINNYNAIIQTADGDFYDKETLFYHAILYNDSQAILMSACGDLNKREEWLTKFQKTLESVKFK
jgi:hypothetical protein